MAFVGDMKFLDGRSLSIWDLSLSSLVVRQMSYY